jgi:hypothetical protein
MKALTLVKRQAMRVLIVAAFAAVTGCVADGGYDGGVSVGYDVGFYEPFGYD